ncbi:hypothetical protein [Streptomyces parvulus]|uniref:hypothetical protein n=1 Tax=Streptomyces parvulus TaxID=146923 RepID=UPI0033D8D283
MNDPNALSADARAVREAIDRLTTQVKRLADGPSPGTDGVSKPVVVAHGNPDMSPAAREALEALAAVAVQQMTDAPTTVDDGPLCEHEGPHPDFTCGEVDAALPYFRVRWEEERAQQAPAADEDAQRAARRDSLRNLLARLERTQLHATEIYLLRQHAEAEMREVDTARAVAAGNKRHVQLLYAELQEAQKQTRQAEELLSVAHETSNRSETERTRAVVRAEEIERERNQQAAVLAEVLATFVHPVPGYRLPRVRSGEVDVETLRKWRSVVQHDVERPWWKQVDEARAELEQAQAALERARSLHRPQPYRDEQTICTSCSAYDPSTDSCDSPPVPYEQCPTLLALDGTEQPNTEA